MRPAIGKMIRVSLIVGFLSVSSLADAASGELSSSLSQIIDGGSSGNVVAGACVIDLASGEVVFQRQADAPMVPASCMKVFAMVAALAELGPDFVFETSLATDGQNLIVVGSGDPGFGDPRLCAARGDDVSADLEQWADLLLNLGIKTITGDIVLDESAFDSELVNPGWASEDLGKWYAAPVGAINFNDNCLDVTLIPGGRIGGPTTVSVVPKSAIRFITNRSITSASGKPILHRDPHGVEYIVSGGCTKRWQFGAVAFHDPGLLFAEAMRSSFKEKGVAILGDVRRRRARSEGEIAGQDLVVIASRKTPIGDVLARAGKNSQNLFAECLLKRAGLSWESRRRGRLAVGSWENGSLCVLDVARKAGIGVGGLEVLDGSGLSRGNRCTARQLASLLTWARRQPYGLLLQESLAAGGERGSLRKRLHDLSGRVRGKTGTMRGVCALSGFVLPAESDGGLDGFVFSIIFNGYRGPSGPFRRIQDEACRAMAAELDRRSPRG